MSTGEMAPSEAHNLTVLPCPIYFTTPACNVTWAEYIGPTHDVICWTYVAITVLLLLYSIFVLFDHVRKSGVRPFNRPYEKPVVFCAFLTTVSLTVTAADPFAYRGLYGRPVFDLLRTTTILLALMCLAMMIVKWQGLLSGRLKAIMPMDRTPAAILKQWAVVGVSYAVTAGVWVLSVFLTALCAVGVISDNLFLVLLTVFNALAVGTITFLYGFHTILIIRLIVASKTRQQRLLAFGHSEVPGAGQGADFKRQKEESDRAVITSVFQMRLTIKSSIIFSLLLICTFALVFRLYVVARRYTSGTTTFSIPSLQRLMLTDLGFCAFALQAGLFAILYFSKPRENMSRTEFTRLNTGSSNGQGCQGGHNVLAAPTSTTTLSRVNTDLCLIPSNVCADDSCSFDSSIGTMKTTASLGAQAKAGKRRKSTCSGVGQLIVLPIPEAEATAVAAECVSVEARQTDAAIVCGNLDATGMGEGLSRPAMNTFDIARV